MIQAIVPGRSYSVATVIADEANPLVTGAAATGLTVVGVLSDTPGGDALDPGCSYDGTAQGTTPAGYTGTVYLLTITGSSTATPLASRVGRRVYLNVTANGEPVDSVELQVVADE